MPYPSNLVVLGSFMKKLVSSILMTAGILPTISFAAEQANKLTLQGEVTTKTCEVSVNGKATSPVITLPPVSASLLSSAGKTAGDTKFSIEIKNCPNYSNAKAWIYTALNGSQGNVLNTAGTAHNVDIRIIDGVTNQQVFMTHATSTANFDSSHSATIPLVAQYYATDSAISGTVIGTANYLLQYE